MRSANGERVIGEHAGCGGAVLYAWSRSHGYRVCLKCRQSSLKGASPETVEEVRKREAF